MAEDNHYQELDDVEAQTQDVPKSRGLLKYFVGVTMVVLVFCGLVAHSSMVQTNITSSLIASGNNWPSGGGLKKCKECMLKCYDPNAKQKCSNEELFECKNACKSHPGEGVAKSEVSLSAGGDCMGICEEEYSDCEDTIGDEDVCETQLSTCQNYCDPIDSTSLNVLQSVAGGLPEISEGLPSHDNLIASGGGREGCMADCDEELPVHHWSDEEYYKCQDDCDKRARKREQCEYEHIDGYGLFDTKCGIYSKYEMKSQKDIDCVCGVYEDTCQFKPAFCQEKKCAAFLAGAASGGERCSDECITDGDCITLCNCP